MRIHCNLLRKEVGTKKGIIRYGQKVFFLVQSGKIQKLHLLNLKNLTPSEFTF